VAIDTGAVSRRAGGNAPSGSVTGSPQAVHVTAAIMPKPLIFIFILVCRKSP
jgi:hypothetical protein